MELKGSKTEKNLMEAFAGESQARNKYTYFASKAKKEGYEQIAAIFQETADNEKERLLQSLHSLKVVNVRLVILQNVRLSQIRKKQYSLSNVSWVKPMIRFRKKLVEYLIK